MGKNSNPMLREICSGIYTHLKCINTHKLLKTKPNAGKHIKAILKYSMWKCKCKWKVPYEGLNIMY